MYLTAIVKKDDILDLNFSEEKSDGDISMNCRLPSSLDPDHSSYEHDTLGMMMMTEKQILPASSKRRGYDDDLFWGHKWWKE